MREFPPGREFAIHGGGISRGIAPARRSDDRQRREIRRVRRSRYAARAFQVPTSRDYLDEEEGRQMNGGMHACCGGYCAGGAR